MSMLSPALQLSDARLTFTVSNASETNTKNAAPISSMRIVIASRMKCESGYHC